MKNQIPNQTSEKKQRRQGLDFSDSMGGKHSGLISQQESIRGYEDRVRNKVQKSKRSQNSLTDKSIEQGLGEEEESIKQRMREWRENEKKFQKFKKVRELSK